MISRTILRAGLLTASLVALSVYAAPVPQQRNTPQSRTVMNDLTAASQSTSGKIAAVASDGFTLEVSKGSSKQTVQFVTDTNTKVKGKLEAGLSASVEYYTDTNGRNIATNIVVESNG